MQPAEISPQLSSLRQRFRAAWDERALWQPHWQDCAKWCFPRRAATVNGSIGQFPQEQMRLWDSTAIRACRLLASGSMQNMSPHDEHWFEFNPADEMSAEWGLWLAKCAEKAHVHLQTTNFYTELHEATLDVSGLGTMAVYAEWSEKQNKLNFVHLPVNTFAFTEDEERRPSTLFRQVHYSAEEAVAKFGAENLSEKIVKQAKDKPQEKVSFIHAIYPRPDGNPAAPEPSEWPWASCYLEGDCERIAQEGGHIEQPFVVGRFLRWASATGGVYGYAPINECFWDSRQINRQQRNLDRIGDRLADPPVWAPEELEGEIDPNPGGITYFSAALSETPPKPWLTTADMSHEFQRLEMRRDAIRDAFYVDMFTAISQRSGSKNMTATEVQELVAEKVAFFSPAFSRRIKEVLTPLLERIFSLMLRHGLFPEPPEQIPSLAFSIQYTSKLAMALQAKPVRAFYRALDRRTAMAQIAPELADNYDWDAAERLTAQNEGFPASAMRSTAAVRQGREAAAKLAEEQQAQQAALALAQSQPMPPQ